MRVSKSHHTDRAGVLAVAAIINNEFSWILREQEQDFGIDAQIEVVTAGAATGKFIAVQIKSGQSYFNHKDPSGFVYRGTSKHLSYWLNCDLPVIVILYDAGSKTAYWQHVTPKNVTRTPKGWKMCIPRQQKLEAAQANRLEEIASTVQRLKEEIREYQCPHCGAPLAERGGDDDRYYEAFQCGYVNQDGMAKPPCPWDPQFPRFEDYDLQFIPIPNDPEKPWCCLAHPKTDKARGLFLDGYGRTKEEAEQKVVAKYERYARKAKF